MSPSNRLIQLSSGPHNVPNIHIPLSSLEGDNTGDNVFALYNICFVGNSVLLMLLFTSNLHALFSWMHFLKEHIGAKPAPCTYTVYFQCFFLLACGDYWGQSCWAEHRESVRMCSNPEWWIFHQGTFVFVWVSCANFVVLCVAEDSLLLAKPLILMLTLFSCC